MLFFPNNRGKYNAVFVYPRKPGLSAEVGARRFAAVQQPKNRPRNGPEDLRKEEVIGAREHQGS